MNQLTQLNLENAPSRWRLRHESRFCAVPCRAGDAAFCAGSTTETRDRGYTNGVRTRSNRVSGRHRRGDRVAQASGTTMTEIDEHDCPYCAGPIDLGDWSPATLESASTKTIITE